MFDVDEFCLWVFVVDVCGELYVVIFKKVKLICLVLNFIFFNFLYFVFDVKYILYISICFIFCIYLNIKKIIKI